MEADEYAGNFDPYRPDVAVVLNADWDHPDVFADRTAVVDAFEAWLRGPGAQTRRVVIGTDDVGGAELARRLGDWEARVIPVRAQRAQAGPGAAASSLTGEPESVPDGTLYRLDGTRLSLSGLPGPSRPGLEAELRLAGQHNAANAACVATAAALLGVDRPDIAAGLSSFEGVGRRFEVKGEPAGVLVIDDYGHHPTAIRATIEAARERHPGRPVWVAHEPLTFHRAAAMLDELAAALATADHVVIADIWAGRDPDTTSPAPRRSRPPSHAWAVRTSQRPAAWRPRPTIWRRGSSPATSCWPWVAAAPTSSPSDSWPCWRPGPTGRMPACLMT